MKLIALAVLAVAFTIANLVAGIVPEDPTKGICVFGHCANEPDL